MHARGEIDWILTRLTRPPLCSKTQPRDIFKICEADSTGVTILLRAIAGHSVYVKLDDATLSSWVEAALSSDGIVATHTTRTAKNIATVTWCVQACVATFKLTRGVTWRNIGLEQMVANVYMALRNSSFNTSRGATDKFYIRSVDFLTRTYGDGMDSGVAGTPIFPSISDPGDQPQQKRSAQSHGNALFCAIEAGSLRRATELLSMGTIDLEETDSRGYTPLIFAAFYDRADFVRPLLRSGADVFASTDEGYTALAASVKNGNLAIAHMLVRAGADPNVRYVDGRFPLYRATWDQNVAMATLLVKAGADYHMPYENGETTLHLAAHLGNTKIADMLISAGVNVNARMIGGYTALHRATQSGQGGVVKTLINAGADPSLGYSEGEIALVPMDFAVCHGTVDREDVSVLKELIACCGIERCWGESKGTNALRHAIRVSSLPVVDVLIEAGVVDAGGALIVAVNNADSACVARLLRACPPSRQPRYVNATPTPEDDIGVVSRKCSVTPLTLAIRQFGKYSSSKIAQHLIECGADTTVGVYVTHDDGKPDELMAPVELADHLLSQETCRDDCSRARLAGMGRLLRRADAIRAGSWLWPSPPVATVPSATVAGGGPREATLLMLRNMRRRVRVHKISIALRLHEARVAAAWLV